MGRPKAGEPDTLMCQFAEQLFAGTRAPEAYRTVYPDDAAKRTGSGLIQRASEFAHHPKVEELLTLMRQQMLDAGLWTRKEAALTLVDLAKNGDTSSSRVAASRELNAMFGHNAPVELNINAVSRVVVEFAFPALEHQP